MKQTALPLDEARTLAGQVRRVRIVLINQQVLCKGYAIHMLTSITKSTTIAKHNVRAAFHFWAEYTFGVDVKLDLLRKRAEERASAMDVTDSLDLPSRFKEKLTLLRTEQLFLMKEIGKTFDEVRQQEKSASIPDQLSTLNAAMKVSPAEANILFEKFKVSY